ncbi:tudor domain-containing protein 15 [Trichomycterus rosablanca]|uniref:tudor domain-containing protein 15 n=1 Tax=Trichomycterus rosablanca TaxID=2290929 RepID=UPI002F35DF9D
MDWMQTDRSKEDPKLPAPCTLWPVDLKLTHIDCNPDDTLVHFQGQHVSICELDYNILQVEIQNAHKSPGCLEVGDFCLVGDVLSSRWFRGRIQNLSRGAFEVFLLDHGNVLTVGPNHLSQISDALLVLPPKIVCGFVANVLPVQERWDATSEKYFSSLIGSHVKGYIHGLLPHKVLILEVPEISKDLLRLSLCRHLDTDTFLFVVEMLIEIPVQQNSQPVPDLLLEKQIVQELSFKSSNVCGFENILSLSRTKLEVGQKKSVRITAAVNPELFYCQLSSVASDLKGMSEKLALVCESKTSACRNNPGENMGLLCAIKGKDQKWHRGFVQCLPVNSHVRVVFVDCGYCESVNVENVHQLPSDFLLTPIGTFLCSLSCLSDEVEDVKNKQLFLLRQGLLGKEMKITVSGLSKERNVYSVTLSSVVRDTLTEPVPTKYSDKITNGDVLMRCANTIQTIGTSKDDDFLKDFVEGSVFEGYVEHVQSPNDFWMRTAQRNADFESMMSKLTDYFSRLQLHEQIFEDPVPGVLCCAMYEQDLHYYRALVVDTLENGAEVFFIDFGNTEKVPSLLIKQLPEEFAAEPGFALGCSLAHAAPMEDVWTVASIEFFRNVMQNKVLVAHVVHRRNDTFVVELFEKGMENSESITALMSRVNMAEYWEYNSTSVSVKPKKEKETTNEKFRIKQFAQRTQNPATSQDKVVEEQAPNVNPKPSAVELFKPQKFQPGIEITVQCTYVGSPSNFWCQNTKHKVDLEELNERLQAFYKTNSPILQPHRVCCAVRFQQYDRWYRGYITGGKTSDVEVTLVDYGLVLQEKLENLRALMPEFFLLEAQAFPCSLYNLIEPAEGSVWSEEASALLKDFVSIRPLNLTCKIYSQLTVVNKGLCNVVDLYTPVQRATAYLVGKGVAVEIRCPKKLVPSACPCSFVYSSFNIAAGDEELVYCTHAVSPWEVYLQLDRNTEIVEKLMERTMKESEELLKLRHAGQTGTVCLAKYFGDGMWYRSFVWPAKSTRHLNAFFVDFGNKQVAEIDNVLPIPREAVDLLFTPMQALRCSLAGVPEDEHLSEVNAWLNQTVLNKTLRAEFVAANESGHFVCDLFDGDTHVNEKVKELFEVHAQKKRAVKENTKQSSRSKKVTKVSSDLSKCKTASRSRAETVVQRTSNHNKSTPRSRQSCQKNSPKIKYHNQTVQGKNRDGTKLMGQSKKVLEEKDNIKTSFKVQPSVMMPKLSDLPNTKLAPGFKDVGFISHCGSSDNFFIQMETDEPRILKMVEELNSDAFTESKKPVTSEVRVGDLVVAVYEEDHALYRAVVTGIASSGIITVEFIDYGNTTAIEKQNMYHLARRFLSESRLSITCTLSKPRNVQDVTSFTKEAQNKPLMIEFVQNLGSMWKVSVEILDPLLESTPDENIKVVPASNQANPGQDLDAALNEHEKQNSNLKQDEKSNSQLEKFVIGTKDKVVQWRISGKKHSARRRVRPERSYKMKHGKKQATPDNWNMGVSENPRGVFGLEQSNNVGGDVQDDVVLILSETCPENPINKADQVQRLFLTPVKTDHEYSGFAAAVTTPGEFYILLEDCLLTLNAVSNILENLPEELSSLPESHLIPGAGCLLKPGDKNKWCRAEIKQCDDASVILNLVDYGHCESLLRQSAHRLKELPEELAALPKLTYPCLLRGIKPVGSVRWSDDAVTFFQECMYKKNLQIFFRQLVSEVQWEVDAFTGDENIAKALYDADHASYVDAVLGIRFQQSLRRTISEQSQSEIAEVQHGTLEDATWSGEEASSFKHKSGHGTRHDVPSGLRQCRLM